MINIAEKTENVYCLCPENQYPPGQKKNEETHEKHLRTEYSRITQARAMTRHRRKKEHLEKIIEITTFLTKMEQPVQDA